MLKRKRHPARARLLRADAGRPQLPLFSDAESSAAATYKPKDSVSPAARWPVADTNVDRRPAAGQLWVCIVFPEVAFEAIADPVTQDCSAAVISVETGGQSLVYAANAGATTAGIFSGMQLNAALALLPSVRIYPRDPAAEERRLKQLARWATGYTPVVCIDDDGALFLEVASSLRLFGGLARLEERLRTALLRRKLKAHLAAAPFARAALWLARAGHEVSCWTAHDAQILLSKLPLSAAGWPASVQERLQRMGVRRLGDCLRLPRDGFARRIGVMYLRELDAALGRQPELRQSYQEPVRFAEQIDFGGEIFALEQIIQATEKLLDSLRLFLLRRQFAVTRLRLQMNHCSLPPSYVSLEPSEPVHEITYLGELLQLKLDRQTLIAPVTGLAMAAVTTELQPAGASMAGRELWGDAPATVSDLLLRLLERFRARLGHQAVYGMAVAADHRPERSWRPVAEPLGDTAPEIPGQMFSRPRPLWLLREPVRLQVCDGRPMYRGHVSFSGDCERIESGWWDGAGVRRKYYVVTGQQGGRWWIYREQQHWYLHGLFG